MLNRNIASNIKNQKSKSTQAANSPLKALDITVLASPHLQPFQIKSNMTR
jgi:hypothetical protein